MAILLLYNTEDIYTVQQLTDSTQIKIVRKQEDSTIMLKQDPDISQMMILHTNRAFLCVLGHIGAGFANFIEI